MTAEEIRSLVASLGTILTVLRDADPQDKAEIYRGIGLRLTYHPAEDKVIARRGRRRSGTKVRVRGPSWTMST
jgi:hypothetical protein